MTNPNTVDDSCLQPERVQLLSDAEDTFRVLKELYTEQVNGVMVLWGDESLRRRAGLSDRDVSFIEDVKKGLLSFF